MMCASNGLLVNGRLQNCRSSKLPCSEFQSVQVQLSQCFSEPCSIVNKTSWSTFLVDFNSTILPSLQILYFATLFLSQIQPNKPWLRTPWALEHERTRRREGEQPTSGAIPSPLPSSGDRLHLSPPLAPLRTNCSTTCNILANG